MAKIRAFLDTSVIVRVLFEHKPPNIFEEEVLVRVTYVVGSIVLQELLLASERRSLESPLKALEKFVEIVPVDAAMFDEASIKRIRRLRNLSVHSNDILVMSSAGAADCEFLLTWDKDILAASGDEPFTAITPEDFLNLVRGEQ
jgi:predicted nucleic acid-binding protein